MGSRRGQSAMQVAFGQQPVRLAKGQSAMEFLMTYGWAILVMIIVVAVLFYMGVMNPRNAQPSICNLPAGHTCYTFKVVNGTGMLELELGQSLGKSIEVLAVGCATDESAALTTLENPVIIGSGEHRYIAGGESGSYIECLDEDGQPLLSSQMGDNYRGVVCIRYRELDSGIVRTVCGDISTQLEPGGSGGSWVRPSPTASPSPGCTGYFTGLVKNQWDGAISGATVTAGNFTYSGSDLTDSSGEYSIHGLCDGEYNLEASMVDHTSQSAGGIIVFGGGSSINFVLDSSGSQPPPACAPDCPTDSPCTGHADCESGYCDPVTETCQPAPEGSDCTDDTQCESGYCDPVTETCQPAPEGSDCTDDTQCESGYCDPVTETCQLAPEGNDCTDDTQCESGYCDPVALVCGPEPPPACSPECPNDSPCTGDADCASDYCDTTSGVCKTAPPICITCQGNYNAKRDYILCSNLLCASTGAVFQSGASGSTIDCEGKSFGGTRNLLVGFYLQYVNNITIKNCVMQGWSAGVYLYSDSGGNTISSNVINGCQYGIAIDSPSHNNTIIGNTLWGNNIGIWLKDNARDNTFTGNTVTAVTVGQKTFQCGTTAPNIDGGNTCNRDNYCTSWLTSCP